MTACSRLFINTHKLIKKNIYESIYRTLFSFLMLLFNMPSTLTNMKNWEKTHGIITQKLENFICRKGQVGFVFTANREEFL